MPDGAQPLLLVHGHPEPRLDIRRAMAKRYHFSECMLHELRSRLADEPAELVIDAPLETVDEFRIVQAAISGVPKLGSGMAFVIDAPSRALILRAQALGAEATVPRPISEPRLFAAVSLLLDRACKENWVSSLGEQAEGLTAGSDVLDSLYRFASGGTRITQYELYDQGDVVIDTLAETGLGKWIEAVRAHHSQTFRHSLLVTGIAVSFGHQLKMRQDDLRRLVMGGLIHDIGKASIPVDILEKPDALTPQETEIMRQHPGLGRNFLQRQGGFAPEMIDVVAHHHEMLDGSGYPDGLSGNRISDLVRVVTIADIFAALVEQRAYKAAMRREDAYAYLTTLAGKVDMSLVRAFEPIALETLLAA